MTRLSALRRSPLASAAPWRGAVGAALLTRLGVLLVTALTLGLFYPRRNRSAELWNAGSLNEHSLLEHVLHASERGDSAIWLHAARTLAQPTTDWHAWSPLYPSIVRLLGAFGLPLWLAGTFVSLGSLVVAAALVRALCAAHLAAADQRQTRAMRATWVWLVFPGAVMLGFVAPYSLVALLVAATWLAVLRDRHGLAAVAAGFALLAHPAGIAALPLLAHRSVRVARGKRAHTRALAIALAIGASGWSLVAWRGASLDAVRDALQPRGALADLGRALGDGTHALLFDVVDLRQTPRSPFGDEVGAGFLNLATMALAVALVVAAVFAWRRLGAPAGLSVLLLVLGTLAAPASQAVPLAALPHLAPLALPAFLLVGAWASANDTRFLSYIGASATLFGTVATGVALWNFFG